ncbi:ankyrin repeat domain-containing protein, partial [Candidatus Dependentiae bacterium]|nr:ankyrin repeat domain-containing protein [Candidatus Dependentiae bacterium]
MKFSQLLIVIFVITTSLMHAMDQSNIKKTFSNTTDTQNAPLYIALANHDLEKAEYLLKNGIHTSKVDKYQALKITAKLVAIIVNEKRLPNVKDYFTHLLGWAVEYRHDILVRLLLTIQRPYYDNLFCCILLSRFIKSNDVNTVKLILDSTLSVDIHNGDHVTPLHYAIKEDCKEVAEFLINQGANVNALDRDKQTPLHYAVKYNRVTILPLLIKNQSISLEAKDKCGNTPLNLAAQRDTSLDIIKQLLNSKAHIATIDNDGVNPLFYASAYGHTDTVRLLIDAGANVDAQEPKGNFSPLHVAAQNGHITIVELLLSKGARTEVQTNAKETPLHSAAANDHKSIVELLVAKGATIDVQNKDNCTPLYSAIR